MTFTCHVDGTPRPAAAFSKHESARALSTMIVHFSLFAARCFSFSWKLLCQQVRAADVDSSRSTASNPYPNQLPPVSCPVAIAEVKPLYHSSGLITLSFSLSFRSLFYYSKPRFTLLSLSLSTRCQAWKQRACREDTDSLYISARSDAQLLLKSERRRRRRSRKKKKDMGQKSFFLFAIILGAFAVSAVMAAEEESNECDLNFRGSCYDKAKAMKLKIIAIFVILIASMAGIALPLLSRYFPAFSMEKPLFSIVKAFASGVILSTGFMHVLPDSLADLESPCLPDNPWHEFPFTTFIAMVSAVGTLMMDSFSMAVHHRNDRESSAIHASPSLHIHGHGHDHSLTVSEGPVNKEDQVSSTLKRNRVIAMVC